MTLVRAQNGILRANSALTCVQVNLKLTWQMKHFDWSIFYSSVCFGGEVVA